MIREFSPREAVEELNRRRQDLKLVQEVEEFISEMPESLPKVPFAALCRQVATARGEDLSFASLAEEMGVMPFWPTFVGDNFTTRNPDKVKLCKLPIDGSEPRSRKIVRRMDLYDGVSKLSEVVTECRTDGQPLKLPDVHQLIRVHVLNGTSGNTEDFTQWLYQIATKKGAVPGDNLAKWYYPEYLSLFVAHGILVEDFCGGPNGDSGLGRFVAEVVNPSALQVRCKFGVDPIYVRLPWKAGYELYPANVLSVLDLLMSK